MSSYLRQHWAAVNAAHAWEPDSVAGYALPTGAQFAMTKPTLDPAIFDPHSEEMRPVMRATIMQLLDEFWTPRYGDFSQWAVVYLAGSSASYWWQGDNDLDILIGVNLAKFERSHPGLIMDEFDLCDRFNDEFRADFDPQHESYMLPGEPEPFSVTFYVNPGSYDIRAIHPYAAYDVTHDRWIVHPARMDKRWGPKQFGWPFWERMGRLADHIKNDILTLPEPERTEQAEALFHELHAARQQSYSPTGGGVYSRGNMQWLILERWGVLQQLQLAAHPDSTPHPAPTVAARS